jgi:uncharacterized membrane protein HdeD (DUF308 family)
MSSAPVTAFVKKSVGWSIALGVVMIVTGLLAIASPVDPVAWSKNRTKSKVRC